MRSAHMIQTNFDVSNIIFNYLFLTLHVKNPLLFLLDFSNRAKKLKLGMVSPLSLTPEAGNGSLCSTL